MLLEQKEKGGVKGQKEGGLVLSYWRLTQVDCSRGLHLPQDF